MAPFTSYMQEALREARAAADRDETPVGAVIVDPLFAPDPSSVAKTDLTGSLSPDFEPGRRANSEAGLALTLKSFPVLPPSTLASPKAACARSSTDSTLLTDK